MTAIISPAICFRESSDLFPPLDEDTRFPNTLLQQNRRNLIRAANFVLARVLPSVPCAAIYNIKFGNNGLSWTICISHTKIHNIYYP